MPIKVRRAEFSDMEAVARLHRRVRNISLPYLPDLHTPEEDLAFFEEKVFPNSTMWLAEEGYELIGFAAASRDQLDHLYVDPAWHGQGVGSALLFVIKKGRRQLDLWTFQDNLQARQFYERRGFKPVETTDGSGNPERLPDVRYRWTGD
ncbi:GNAT family N-acetyltransferase [Microvirga roseola]|uniref:GNAT family N-acetyltransferase n=1 Tax=Microvirga roseola TaxID=2883126 RepID=UPI001E3BAE11|nr:GNAT family N-acetyltransferase [Microvirga roseola]